MSSFSKILQKFVINSFIYDYLHFLYFSNILSKQLIKSIEFVNSHVYIGKILIFLSTFLYNMLLEFF